MDLRHDVCLRCEVAGKARNIRGGSSSLVVFGRTVGLREAVAEVLDCWETFNAESSSDLFISISVYFRELNLAFHLSGCLIPFWFEGFAVAAPWCIQLDHPDVLGGIDDIVEVSVSEHDHIAVSHWLLGFLFFLFATL